MSDRDPFLFLDKDAPERSRAYGPDTYPVGPYDPMTTCPRCKTAVSVMDEAAHKADCSFPEGDGFCARCLLPISLCACRPRHGG